jgi:hypothetical protein
MEEDIKRKMNFIGKRVDAFIVTVERYISGRNGADGGQR